MIGNLFDAIPTDLEDELVELLAGNDSVRIERIVSQGQASPASGWYDQHQHEWVLLLSGAAVLGFEHPITGERLRFTSDLPFELAQLEAALAQGSGEAASPHP